MAYEDRYYRNRNCPCARCRMRGVMGPAVLITLGVLFMLDTVGVRSFHYTWPVLLIVIGVVQVLQHNASTEGHIQPIFPSRAPQAPAPPPPPAAPPPAGIAPGSSSGGGTGGVNHV
ncbi:MAG TPA: DUF5668 domain-containing protein [Terriglobales bacterium]|nr:DUF5668 domain-containing protein [Terriglobales bacterium]